MERRINKGRSFYVLRQLIKRMKIMQWHCIRYADGSEEFHDHPGDADELTNLAGEAKMAKVIDRFAPGSKGIACPHFQDF